MSNYQCVLIVDDDQPVRQLMAAVISGGGYASLQAQDGAEALQIAERNRIDLVVTDIDMPGISGLELIRVLRGRGLADRSLIVTGSGGYLSPTSPGFEVPVPCLAKPFRPEQLLANVRALLGS